LRAAARRAARLALATFERSIRAAVATVVAEGLLIGSDRLALANEPAPLGRDRRFGLSLNQHFEVSSIGDDRDGWKVRTLGYSYGLHDRDGRELVVYQWHATGPSPVVWPHLHLGSRLLRPELERPFGAAHLPTERVAVTAVLRAAIEDLGVEPLREDWRERAAAADAVLRASLA
jgi:hypothetical protein